MSNNKDSSQPNIIPDPENMAAVHTQYGALEAAIGELGDKVSGVLTRQEGEFLGAYKTHMRNVQRDFQDLRAVVEEKERAIENNVKVRQLEKERDWYRKEALHLDRVLNQVKTSEQELREKNDELEEDRSWLTRQLKIVMKQKATLEYQLTSSTSSVHLREQPTILSREEGEDEYGEQQQHDTLKNDPVATKVDFIDSVTEGNRNQYSIQSNNDTTSGIDDDGEHDDETSILNSDKKETPEEYASVYGSVDEYSEDGEDGSYDKLT